MFLPNALVILILNALSKTGASTAGLWHCLSRESVQHLGEGGYKGSPILQISQKALQKGVAQCNNSVKNNLVSFQSFCHLVAGSQRGCWEDGGRRGLQTPGTVCQLLLQPTSPRGPKPHVHPACGCVSAATALPAHPGHQQM